ncbi:MAG TPA: hypothetical protein P5345_01415 [Candidatus Paceibacterota bacterium]|nr:hypothetical protein [Candidatus Paceibacterota bacterium]
MTKQDQIPIEGKEENKKEQIPLDDSEFWVIDDSTDMIGSLMRMWQQVIDQYHLKAQIFKTAAEALAEINRRKEEKRPLPGVIFMDAWLDKDELEELQYGGNVIKKIREMDDILQPLIVAHSSEDRYNESLKASGADLMIKKGDYKASKAFLENLGQSNKTKNKKD